MVIRLGHCPEHTTPIAGKYEGMVYSCIKRNILEIPELEL